MSRFQRRPPVAELPFVAAERLRLAELLEGLEAADWATPSLCPGWTVHDVTAHLTLSTRQHLWPTLRRTLRLRGDYERAELELARDRAVDFTAEQLIGQLRDMAWTPRRFALSGRLDPLVDILVHAQDIARPLRLDHPMPAERVAPVLDHVWKASFYGAQRRLKGSRLAATDLDWSVGDGPRVINSPAGELLLLMTGRPVPSISTEGTQAAEDPSGR